MKTLPCKTILVSLALPLALGCGSDGDGGGDGDGTGDGEIPSYMATGTVLDFETGEPLETATVSTDGLSPAPTISITGPSFTIEGIPPHSVFNVLAGAPPTFRSTYNAPVTVEDGHVDGIEVYAVGEQFLSGLESAFGVSPASDTTVLLAHLVDEQGAPLAGVPGTEFELPDTVSGPFFLDADRNPDPNLSESSASGWVVFFDVEPGLVSVSASPDSDYGMTMPESPAAATAVTLADIEVRPGQAPELPQDVSFSEDVAPIFIDRGCESCHDGGGIGKDLGDLHLNGAPEKMHRELTEELSPNYAVTRVDPQSPEESLLLTMPSREDPPDSHPNVTFASADDPDYLTILVWIQEGALLN